MQNKIRNNNNIINNLSHASGGGGGGGSAGGSTGNSSDSSGDPAGTTNNHRWASSLLLECARAISDKDSSKIHHLLWMLNELASPYGDSDQKLAAHFLQALFCKATDSGPRCFKTLTAVAEKSHSFDTARKLILKFQEVSPWTTFGHVAANGAILEAFDGCGDANNKIHIVDISNTLCTQWPTLLESLATRNNVDTPHLKLTVVVTETIVRSVMKEVSQRMEKFARLMGVPFEFKVISFPNHHNISQLLNKESLGISDDEALAINCVGAFRRIPVDDRDNTIRKLLSLNPKVVTLVEEEADFSSNRDNFVKCFEESLRFYSVYMEMLEESFPVTSNEKLMLERECSRSMVRILACNEEEMVMSGGGGGDECERRERARQWCERLRQRLSPVAFSDDVVDDVRALLKRYRGGWGFQVADDDHHHHHHQLQQQVAMEGNDDDQAAMAGAGLFLTWKDEAVVWASAWKP